MQIVTAYMTREEGAYMRDYVMDPEGNIETLAFIRYTDRITVNFSRQRIPLDCRTKYMSVLILK